MAVLTYYFANFPSFISLLSKVKDQVNKKTTSLSPPYLQDEWESTLSPILRSDMRHKSRLSHVNVFLSHYGGQLKTAVEQEAGEKIDWKW